MAEANRRLTSSILSALNWAIWTTSFNLQWLGDDINNNMPPDLSFLAAYHTAAATPEGVMGATHYRLAGEVTTVSRAAELAHHYHAAQ
jgi:hypothetical protein